VQKRVSVFFVLCLLSSLGCTRLFGPSPEWRLGLPSEPTTLDWVDAKNEADFFVLSQLQRALVTKTIDGKETADLATAWSVDMDSRRYQFVLGKHFWCDGVPLRPEDFVHAWERHLKPGSQSVFLGPLLQIDGALDFHQGKSARFSQVGVKALEGGVLEVTLARPDTQFVSKLTNPALGPQRQDVFEKHPQEFATPLHLRTIGAYQPFEWEKGKRLVLVSNSYFPSKIDVARVALSFPTVMEAEAELTKGTIDGYWDFKGSPTLGKRAVSLSSQGPLFLRDLKWR
jgi:oligopeptide transport system substrate-binding protein